MHEAALTFDPHAEEDRTSTGIPHDKMGMWVFLCSEVMFFTGLIGSYIVLRFGSNVAGPQADAQHLADRGATRSSSSARR